METKVDDPYEYRQKKEESEIKFIAVRENLTEQEKDCHGRGCGFQTREFSYPHISECRGNLTDHICTYYSYLQAEGAYRSLHPRIQWDEDYTNILNMKTLMRHKLDSGPIISRSMIPRPCRYCFQIIVAGVQRIRMSNDISYHPECFRLHCLFTKQLIEESLKTFNNP